MKVIRYTEYNPSSKPNAHYAKMDKLDKLWIAGKIKALWDELLDQADLNNLDILSTLNMPSGLINKKHHNSTYVELLEGLFENVVEKGNDLSVKQLDPLKFIAKVLLDEEIKFVEF